MPPTEKCALSGLFAPPPARPVLEEKDNGEGRNSCVEHFDDISARRNSKQRVALLTRQGLKVNETPEDKLRVEQVSLLLSLSVSRGLKQFSSDILLAGGRSMVDRSEKEGRGLTLSLLHVFVGRSARHLLE